MIRFQPSPGDWVVQRNSKIGTKPTAFAWYANQSPTSEFYSYVVEKYWIVKNILDDGRLLLRTPRGKQHFVTADMPDL